MGTERFKGALLAALIIASLITPLLLLSPSPVHAALTPHAPIYIDGNAGFTPENGVNGGGSGTENDPYIIENYSINAENANGIEIRNTTVQFIIRNCLVENGENNYNFGIYLENVINGQVENCTFKNNYCGMYLNSSFNNTLSNNTCLNNDSLLDGFLGGSAGIFLKTSDNNAVINNATNSNGDYGICIEGSEKNTIVNNVVWANAEDGISLKNSNFSDIKNNEVVTNNIYGIFLSDSEKNNITNNYVNSNTWVGIGLESSSDNNSVTKNTVTSNRYGIEIDGLGNTVENNTLSGNFRNGIRLWSGSFNTIVNNKIRNHAYHGIDCLDQSENNHISHNNFQNNSYWTGGPQVHDYSSNYWDNGYPSGGNYWSDYMGVDENHGENQDIPGSDGIGDMPYYIPGDNNLDRYPLVWTGAAVFSLVDLYTVNVEKILDLIQGSKLVVKFYTYGDIFENENVIENFSPPWHVEENEHARHPEGIGVKKVKLNLTTENTENVISTIASFTVTKVMLEIRFAEIPLEWALASPAGRVALEIEFSQVPLYWALAPD